MPLMRPVTFSLHAALTNWQWSPFSLAVVAGLVAVAYWYLRADWILATRGRRWPAKRTLPFLAGLLAIDAALQSPVATFTASYFQAHVVQHLLLMIVAPPLLAFGAPSTLLLQTAGPKTKRRWLAVLRSRPFAVLTHPVTVWSLYFGLMFGFFLTSLINTAMNDMALMDVINLVFLLGGTLYWWPMVGLDPIVHWRMGYGAKMANALLGAAPETFLGVVILLQRHPIASMYTLASTHSGGGLLWSSTELATIAAFVPIFVQWMRSEERIATRNDERMDRARLVLAAAAPSRTADSTLSVPAADASAPPGSRLRPDRTSAWEAAWLAKTGAIPGEQFGPD
jgi:putative membrane protein